MLPGIPPKPAPKRGRGLGAPPATHVPHNLPDEADEVDVKGLALLVGAVQSAEQSVRHAAEQRAWQSAEEGAGEGEGAKEGKVEERAEAGTLLLKPRERLS